MKLALGLALAAFATLATAHAAPRNLDVSKRAPRVSTEERAVLPENRPLERNEVLMDRRVPTETIERKEALVGERRSNITLEETREKKFFSTPERREFEVIERKENRWQGRESRFSTREDAYRTQVATRFQDKIGEATPYNGRVQPVIEKRTTFDRVNRFAFRRNGDQTPGVTAAGSEQPARDISGESSPGGTPFGIGSVPAARTGPAAPAAPAAGAR
jgi:hypothetical protein